MTKSIISKTLCVIPWIHLNITPNGKVLHCCMTSDMDFHIGDTYLNSPEEIWNSDNMKWIRRQMLSGNKPSVCSKCYEKEESAGGSHRLIYNKRFIRKFFEIPRITGDTGHVEHLDLKYWDFRFSNICNFKCRICGPESSSTWTSDAKVLGRIDSQTTRHLLELKSVGGTSPREFLKKYFDQVENIYFAGGEPLLMDEHWHILEMLDTNQRHYVQISYTTNLSTLKFKGKNALDYWVKWGRNVIICPSIDEVDERAELLRSGTVWQKVEENLRAVGASGVRVWPNITVSALNVFRLTLIIDRLMQIGIIKKDHENFRNFTLNILEEPPCYHVSVLPQKMRFELKKNLLGYLSKFKAKHNVDIGAQFLHLLWHLDKQWNKRGMADFIDVTHSLDYIRHEKTISVIPELHEILSDNELQVKSRKK